MPTWPSKLFLPLAFCVALLGGMPRSVSGGQARHAKRSHARRLAGGAERRRRDALAHKLHSLHGRMHGVRSRIHASRVQEIHITETIGVVQTRIQKTHQHLNRVNEQLEELDAQHETVSRRLDDTQARLAHEKDVLSQRLRSNYERRKTTYIQALLQSGSVHEMLSRAYLVRLIVKSDAELIRGVQTDIVAIEADKRTVESQEQKEHRLATELDAQKRHYAADVVKRRILLHEVKAQRVEAEQELDELESEANAMTDRIRQLSKILRQQLEAARRAAIAARRHGRRSRVSARELALPTVWHGGMIRPCSGPITSGFGMRFHPILHRNRMHTGVDFGAGFGAPIRAAAAGVVLLSAYNRGYGNCIILYHGGGVTTLYGHCSSRLVHSGDSVRQGQQIATVGASGLATGPHLHFEVRRNGVPVAPY
jgi:murein DD-endopeptidase MepM/ murein hydrolase activator NlpD